MKKVIYGVLAFSPELALAANFTFFTDLAGTMKQVVNMLIPVFFGIAIIYFFWGLAKFIRSAGDPKAASEGKGIMIWGILAIAVMASMWGLVAWLGTTIGVTTTGTTPVIPQI